MQRRGTVGLHKGLSKHVKMSVYGLGEEEIDSMLAAFREVAEMKV